MGHYAAMSFDRTLSILINNLAKRAFHYASAPKKVVGHRHKGGLIRHHARSLRLTYNELFFWFIPRNLHAMF